MKYSQATASTRQLLKPSSLAKQYGFNLVEATLTLALLAAFIASLAMFNASNMRKKDARVLASQTEAFALEFTKYMYTQRDQITSEASSKPVTLSPAILKANWPANLAATNFLGQTPCVTIASNPVTHNVEAILYYVGGKTNFTDNQLEIIRKSAVFLGSKGGVLINGAISGNSGWSVNATSPLLSSTNECGAKLSNSSLVINLDLLPQWNLNLYSPTSILRAPDKYSGLLSLPGHIKNSNTSKSNIYMSNDKGIVLDNSDSNNLTKLSVLYKGQGTKTPTLGFGDKIPTTLIGDTFKTNIQFKSGELCNVDEAGKVVADQGLDTKTNSYLVRSTLVCTQNDMLCGRGNYCYLSTVTNNIVFQNNLQGIQDVNGRFICPAEIPYATNVVVGTPGGNVYVMLNQGGSKITSTINTLQEYPSGGTTVQQFPCVNCNPTLLTDFTNSRDKNKLLGVDLATISGAAISTLSLAPPSAEPVVSSLGSYSTVVGYSIPVVESSVICSNACSALHNSLGHIWQNLGIQRFLRTHESMNIVNAANGCICERTDFSGHEDNHTGIAAVIGNLTPIITTVTCSNAPIYKSSN
ncbi:MAG: hypothetical protein KBD37_00170 [Burkholderiales bacterium]|nr:hypothetical protein [Burkholderiales bacterium]